MIDEIYLPKKGKLLIRAYLRLEYRENIHCCL